MISRRQFFGRAAIGAVGIAAVPFMPWDKLAKLFTFKSKIRRGIPHPRWVSLSGGVYPRKGLDLARDMGLLNRNEILDNMKRHDRLRS